MARKRRANKSIEVSKRQRHGDESDYEESSRVDPVSGQRRALPISSAKLASVTRNTVPQDGETYLAMVKLEAENGPSVMFVKQEFSYDEYNKPTSLASRTASVPVPESTSDFTAILDEFHRMRASIPAPGELPLPADFKYPENFTEWRRYMMANPPVLSLVSNIDHPLTIRLLIYCTQWLTGSVPTQISQWIWALLGRLTGALESSDAAVVRELGKKAIKVRARGPENSSPESRSTAELVQAVVARFFGQRDLEIEL